VAAGKKVFAQCAACHSLDGSPGGAQPQGGLGRQVGSLAGFRFSRALKSAGKTWDEALLKAYVSNPQAAFPGNVMPFSAWPVHRCRRSGRLPEASK
jgi:cytochrome c